MRGSETQTWRGAELSFANLSGADLSGADLTGAELTGANLEGAILKGVRGRADIKGLDSAQNVDKAIFE